MLFIDTSDVLSVKRYLDLGLVSGITTNQMILMKNGQSDVKKAIKDLIGVAYDKPINIELTRTNGSDEDLLNEAREYFDLSHRIVIKVPMWGNGRALKLVKELHKLGIQTNVTCCMNESQVLLAALAQSDYISLFFNRIADYAQSCGCDLCSAYDFACKTVRNSSQIIDMYNCESQIIVGSIRKPDDVVHALLNCADIVTVPPKILDQMFYHPRTEDTIKEFDVAWAKLTQK